MKDERYNFKKLLKEMEKNGKEEEIQIIKGKPESVFKYLLKILDDKQAEALETKFNKLIECLENENVVYEEIGDLVSELVDDIPIEILKELAETTKIEEIKTQIFSLYMALLGYLYTDNKITLNRKDDQNG